MNGIVSFTSPFVPPEWIAAHGLTPRRIVPDCVGIETTREGICSFAAGLERMGNTSTENGLIVLTSTCDQMRRLSERLSDRYGHRVFLMHMPATWENPAALELFKDELRRLGRFLVPHGGQPPSNELLSRLLLEYEKKRQTLLSRRFSLSSRRFSESLFNLYSNESIPEMVERISPPSNLIRIALIGGPLRRQDWILFDLIEQAGGCVVLDATETGERSLPVHLDKDKTITHPLDAMAESYFHGIPDVFRRPNISLYQYLLKQCNERRVQGIVLVRHLWCDLWHAELHRLKNELGRPVIEIDLGTGEGDTPRNRSRIESLMEILR